MAQDRRTLLFAFMKRTLGALAILTLVIATACSDSPDQEPTADERVSPTAPPDLSPQASEAPPPADDVATTSAPPLDEPEPEDPNGPRRLPPDDDPRLVTPEWSLEATIASTPVVADGVVLSNLVGSDRSLLATAWDLQTGAELWREETGPAHYYYRVPPVAPVPLRMGDRTVAVVADRVGRLGDVWLYDLRTGELVSQANDAQSIDHETQLRGCATEEDLAVGGAYDAVCWEGQVFTGTRPELHAARVDASGFSVEPIDHLTSHRYLSDNAWDNLARPPGAEEMLVYTDDDYDVVWSRAYQDIFDVGYSSNFGWDWTEIDGLLVGFGVYRDEEEMLAWWDEDDDELLREDPTASMAVGLDIDTGETIWRVENFELPCADTPIETGVGCDLIAGERVLGPDRSDVQERDLNVERDLVRLDLATGDELWRMPLDRDQDLKPFMSGSAGTESLLTWSEGVAVKVEVETGDSTALDGWPVLPCYTLHEYAWNPSDTSSDALDGAGAEVTQLCDSNGEATGDAATDPVPADLVRARGVEAGDGLWVLATDTGLHMYDLG